MKFHKYQSLGNCYVVVSPEHWEGQHVEDISLLADARWGIGFDGIIIGPWIEKNNYGIRIYNNDGSECLLSGNALRIFSYHLKKTKQTDKDIISLKMLSTGRHVTTTCLPNEYVEVNIGKFSHDMSSFIRDSDLNIDGMKYAVESEHYVTFGINLSNPHLIIDGIPKGGKNQIIKVGQHIGTSKNFPHKSNVHFVEVKDRKNIYLESWERGAGYTLSSSNGAGAAVAHYYTHTLLDDEVLVEMPGGTLLVKIDDEKNIFLTGKVESILEGNLYENC
ncbi:diaminopimelate epimerase [Pantoea sp. Mb-10]|uniref:diaminopimelate epimerase n=1 Tax=unclassified Pantoea TaxID=2630326 RepID=UPI001E4AC57D|nr:MULTISPECIES: diaminopimelate epimerase [unclassified Pantoea]MCE0490291.1 diaminopimelate epimerase [Pantoea sp. Mb-10]MCE0501422.1 diaminopimelate epimerase [Pantoea sp. Pb-8]